MLDTEEIIDQIHAQTNIKVREDISNATKRDDAAGFRLSLDITELGYDKNIKYEDEQVMDELMTKSDEYVKEKIAGLIPEYARFEVYSYSFDEVSCSTLVVLAIMDQYNAYRKLRDVIKRLLTI